MNRYQCKPKSDQAKGYSRFIVLEYEYMIAVFFVSWVTYWLLTIAFTGLPELLIWHSTLVDKINRFREGSLSCIGTCAIPGLIVAVSVMLRKLKWMLYAWISVCVSFVLFWIYNAQITSGMNGWLMAIYCMAMILSEVVKPLLTYAIVKNTSSKWYPNCDLNS